MPEWKRRLRYALADAMANSENMEEYIQLLRNKGIRVNYDKTHKHMTYTDRAGHKCRDNKLFDERWVADERGYAKIKFDTDEEAEKIYQKVKSGTLKGVSVGYSIDSVEEVVAGKTSADGQFTGPCYIARKWTPLEISIVSVPADSTVGVGRDFKEDVPYFVSYGKFSTASRKAANVKVSGNIAYVTESAFKKYGNIKNYWIFSNEYAPATESKPSTTVPNKETKQPTKKYVKTNGAVLNVRSGAGTAYKVVKTLSNNSAVTEYATKNGWSRIDKTKELWVSSKYLTSKEPAKATAPTALVSHVYISATGRYAYCKASDIEKVNGYHRLKKDTVLYSKSNLTGTKYNYLAKTRVSILK